MKRLFFLSILFLIFCGSKDRQSETVSKEDRATIVRSILIVIAPQDFHDEEFKESYDLFKNSGINAVVASTDTTPARGMFGMVVKPDIDLITVDAKDYDGIVIIGGDGCKSLWNNVRLHEIIRGFNDDKKTVAAICMAPMILANAGILEDRIVTAYPSLKDEIGKCCVQCTDSQIEVSANVITCSHPKEAADFARTILRVMNQ